MKPARIPGADPCRGRAPTRRGDNPQARLPNRGGREPHNPRRDVAVADDEPGDQSSAGPRLGLPSPSATRGRPPADWPTDGRRQHAGDHAMSVAATRSGTGPPQTAATHRVIPPAFRRLTKT